MFVLENCEMDFDEIWYWASTLKLSFKFNFGLGWCIVSPYLHETQIEPYQFSQKLLVQKLVHDIIYVIEIYNFYLKYSSMWLVFDKIKII
jgi:hypothetical protein